MGRACAAAALVAAAVPCPGGGDCRGALATSRRPLSRADRRRWISGGGRAAGARRVQRRQRARAVPGAAAAIARTGTSYAGSAHRPRGPRPLAGPAICGAHAAPTARVHDRRRLDPCGRDRIERGDIHRRQRGAAAASAVSGERPARRALYALPSRDRLRLSVLLAVGSGVRRRPRPRRRVCRSRRVYASATAT